MSRSFLAVVSLSVCLFVGQSALGELVITEIMNSSGHLNNLAMDWWELTNTGPAVVNLLGYSWDDEDQHAGTNVFSSITIAAGESIILLEDNGGLRIEAWKTAWRPPPQTQAFGYGAGQPLNAFSGLGSSDAVCLFSPAGQPLTSVAYSGSYRRTVSWHADGLSLGISRPGWLGSYYSDNERPDLGTPGSAWSGTVNPLHEMLYWSDKDARKIQRLNPVTGQVEDILTAADGLLDPRGIALDAPAGKLYWADEDQGAIFCANLDGSDIKTLIDGLMAPADIELNLRDGLLYWADTNAGKIQRLNLHTNQVEDVVTGLIQPYYIELDIVKDALLWSYFNNTIIERTTLTGAAREVVVTGQQRVRDMVATPVGIRIYWADRDAPAIRYMEAGLPIAFDHYGLEAGLIRPHGMALHPLTDALYWTDTGAGNIKVGSVNAGPPASVLVSGLVGPWAVEVISLAPDYNRDTRHDMADLAILARAWQQHNPGADLTGDEFVTLEDLAQAFLPAWLKGPFD